MTKLTIATRRKPQNSATHIGIFGSTGCGKSTLARSLCRKLGEVERDVYVLDPMSNFSDWDGAVEISISPDDFDLLAIGLSNATLFIDEADIYFNERDENFRERIGLLQRGRHRGLQIVAISQRPTALPPIARGQLQKIFAFRLSKKDTQMLADNFGLAVEHLDTPLDVGDYRVFSTTSNPNIVYSGKF